MTVMSKPMIYLYHNDSEYSPTQYEVGQNSWETSLKRMDYHFWVVDFNGKIIEPTPRPEDDCFAGGTFVYEEWSPTKSKFFIDSMMEGMPRRLCEHNGLQVTEANTQKVLRNFWRTKDLRFQCCWINAHVTQMNTEGSRLACGSLLSKEVLTNEKGNKFCGHYVIYGE
jgi:hypothetical protein